MTGWPWLSVAALCAITMAVRWANSPSSPSRATLMGRDSYGTWRVTDAKHTSIKRLKLLPSKSIVSGGCWEGVHYGILLQKLFKGV